MTRIRKQYTDGSYGQLHSRGVFPNDQALPAIICLHMSPKSGRSFHGVLPGLANGRIALAPDYPGMGESTPPPPEPEVAIEDYARAVWQVADALTTGPVHLVGYHTGAMVAAEAAYQQPDRVRSIVSVSAPVYTPEEVAQLHEVFAPLPLDETGSRYAIMWERILAHRGPGMTLPMAAVSMAENLRGGENYEWGHRAAFNFSATYNERLTQLELPVYVINPKDDCFSVTKRADKLLRHGKRKNFEHWGHGFLDAHSDEAVSEILNFVREHDE